MPRRTASDRLAARPAATSASKAASSPGSSRIAIWVDMRQAYDDRQPFGMHPDPPGCFHGITLRRTIRRETGVDLSAGVWFRAFRSQPPLRKDPPEDCGARLVLLGWTMPVVGFHASHEQIHPSVLLEAVRRAEQAGFTAAMCSDHFSPWSARQGHSAFAWSWLGAAMQATSLPFGVVNSPGQRYHPAIIAQAISTLEAMYEGRFWVALGTGEASNEHITGQGWPRKELRNARLREGESNWPSYSTATQVWVWSARSIASQMAAARAPSAKVGNPSGGLPSTAA